MDRPTVAVALPPAEADLVAGELEAAGFGVATITEPRELDALLKSRAGVALAILDAETDHDSALALYERLHEGSRAVPALMVVSEVALERLSSTGGSNEDEYITRPYAADSIRWRIEAMLIRSQVGSTTGADDDETVLTGGDFGLDWGAAAPVIVVFSPKGGVGKTTLATNLAAAMQVRHSRNVLLLDADTVTGHVIMSLGLDGVRTANDAWRDTEEGGTDERLLDVATNHSSGMKVAALTLSPLHIETLEPERVTAAIGAARRGVDVVVIDLHPSYHPLNLAIFAAADHILVPVTPDIPAIRAAVQFAEVAAELDLRDRLAMVVNRANSGVGVDDMERTVGMPALAQVRSGGLLFVKAANVGRTVIDLFPKEKITDDFVQLAARLLGTGGGGARADVGSRGPAMTSASAARAAFPEGASVAAGSAATPRVGGLLGGLFGRRSDPKAAPGAATQA